ncbi:MAG: hypothetical protein PQ964_08195 [Methanobacteriaceae archaeon]|jgi:hypothetical protein
MEIIKVVTAVICWVLGWFLMLYYIGKQPLKESIKNGLICGTTGAIIYLVLVESFDFLLDLFFPI